MNVCKDMVKRKKIKNGQVLSSLKSLVLPFPKPTSHEHFTQNASDELFLLNLWPMGKSLNTSYDRHKRISGVILCVCGSTGDLSESQVTAFRT